MLSAAMFASVRMPRKRNTVSAVPPGNGNDCPSHSASSRLLRRIRVSVRFTYIALRCAASPPCAPCPDAGAGATPCSALRAAPAGSSVPAGSRRQNPRRSAPEASAAPPPRAPHVQRGLGDQQVRALGHADNDLDFGIGKVALELLQKCRDGAAQRRDVVRVKVHVARNADHERRIPGRNAFDCAHREIVLQSDRDVLTR